MDRRTESDGIGVGWEIVGILEAALLSAVAIALSPLTHTKGLRRDSSHKHGRDELPSRLDP